MKGHSLITPTKRDSHKDPVETNADLNSGSPRKSNFSSLDTGEGSNNSLYSPSLNSPLNTSASSDSPLNTSASSDSPLNTSASSDSPLNTSASSDLIYNNIYSRTDSEGIIQNYFPNPIIKARAASQPHKRKMIQWLNYYAKSLLEREEVGYLNLDVDDIEVHVAKAQEGIFIKISETTYLLSETELTLQTENNHVSDITSPILKEMMARGRLQELSKAATHFSALSRLSKMSGNEAPRLGKTEIFDNFEYHDALLKSIEEASNTEQLTRVIEGAIDENNKKLSTAIHKINPVVSALRDIRADLTSSELADGDFKKYKTTFVAPYTESHLVVTIEEKSAIVHIITHAEISKFTIDLSNQNIGEEQIGEEQIGEEQKSSIINFIGNQIRGVDEDKTLDKNLKNNLQKQLAEKLKNPQSIELQPDPILEDLEKDFAALEKSTRKIQRNVRGGLLRKVQTQEAKLKEAFEAAEFDIFGTIDEPGSDEKAKSYEGLEIFKKDGKLEVKQPPKMRNAYKDLLESKPANSDRVKIFEESEALRGVLPCTFTFKGNNLFLRNDKANIFLRNDKANIAFHNESEKIRTFRKHELEDELEILKLFLETQREVELEKFEEALNGFFTPESLETEVLKLKEEYSGFVELEETETAGGDIKLTRQGVTFITYTTNRNIVLDEENGPVIYLDSAIHEIKKATEALGKIKDKILADQIAKEIAKKRFEDAMHQMVDERTDQKVEGSIYSYGDDNYEYKDLGNGVLTFTNFSEDPQFKSIYKKLSDPTLSHVSVDDNPLTEIEEKLITEKLNNLSQTIEQEVENKRASLNSEIAKNLNSMLSDKNPEVATTAQTISRQEDGDSVKFTINDKTSGKQKVFKLYEYNNVLIDDKQPSIARLDDLLKEIQKSNTKDLYDKAAALVNCGQIDFTYNNGSCDVNSSLTVEELTAKEGESAPLAVIISDGNQHYYLEENGLFASTEGNAKGEKIIDPKITQSIKAQLYHASETLLKQRLLSELTEASNDFLGSGEIDKYTGSNAIFLKEKDKDEFEFGTQTSKNKIKFKNSQLVEPENISNAGLIKILDELSTLRESAQVYESQRLKEQYDALINEKNEKYLDIEEGRISIKDNNHKLTTPPAVTCKFQNEAYGEIAEVSIEATEPSDKITNSKSICDILKAQEALAKLQQHIEKIKEREAEDRRRKSRTTSFRRTFHAVAPKTTALAELAKISHEEIPQNKLMHALDKLFKNYELIPKEGTGETKKIEKLDRANKSTLVKHSLEILKKDEIKNTNEIKKLSSYQPNSHNRQDVEELEEKAKNILVEYYKEHEPEKNEMVEKIKLFKATQKEFARGIHDKTSGFKSTDGKPSTFLSDQYAELLQEHKKQTSGSRGGGQR